jgi:hypothetical protein
MPGRRFQWRPKAAIVAISTLCLSGCFTAGLVVGVVTYPVTSTLHAGALAMASDYPDEVLELQGQPPDEVLAGAQSGAAWYELEYARRLENGVRFPRDTVCAYVIFDFNRYNYWAGRSAQKGLTRLEKEPAVVGYLTNGPLRMLGDCIPGHILSGVYSAGAPVGKAPQGND